MFVKPKQSNILDHFPEDKDLFVMCSGGLGSVNSLWRVLQATRDPSIVYVEGMFNKEIDLTRRKCVKALATEARSSSGGPLASGPPWRTWLTTYQAPRGAEKLSRKARIAVLIASLHQCLGGENLPALVWGSVHDCTDVIEAMSHWGFTHVVPMKEREKIIFSLSEAESISLVMKEKHEYGDKEYAPGACLTSGITNLVCSCWGSSKDTTPVKNAKTELHRPFASMCSKCKGCERWYKAWKVLCKNVPSIVVGRRHDIDKDDDRHWSKLPGLKVESKSKRNFDEWIKDKEEKIVKSKLKKQKKGVNTTTNDDEEEEEEEKKEEEEVIIEEEEELDEEELEFMENFIVEENDDYEEDVNIEAPDDGFGSDGGGGYDSDSGPSTKKKRKKKTRAKLSNKIR